MGSCLHNAFAVSAPAACMASHSRDQDLSTTQQQNAELRAHSGHLSARLEEESEVVSALRAQLVEYKLQMGQMQLQAKKGRTLNPNNSTNMMMTMRPGTATPPSGQLGQLGSASGGMWSLTGGSTAAAVAADAALFGGTGSAFQGQAARSGSAAVPHLLGSAVDGTTWNSRAEQQRQLQPNR